MTRTRQGERDAFAALIRRHQQPLVNFFRRMGARTDETEDLVQETFLRVFAYRERYQPTGKFTNFLYVLARHAWADMMRKAARRPRADSGAVENTSVSSGEPGIDARIDVRAALGGLSEKLRMVLVLSVYQGLRQDEIAEVLDIPLGTVKSRMHLAIKGMKELLNVGSAVARD